MENKEDGKCQYISRKLETMLPFEVWKALTDFAKKNARTGLGKYDYGIAIKLLLENQKFSEGYLNVLEEIQKISERISDLEGGSARRDVVKTFGGKEDE